MTDLQFKIARIFIFIAALVLVVNWLSMSSELGIEKSQETKALISYETGKQHQQYISLLTRDLGRIKFQCQGALALCKHPRVRAGTEITVWIQDTGLFSGQWLVAARHQEQWLASVEAQSATYRKAKLAWGLGALAALALVFAIWYFGPFGTARLES
jgi:hypothetical protein